MAVNVSDVQFKALRWIEGAWHSKDGRGVRFFERYRFLNDSTIRSYSYADSTMRSPNDSGVILRRGGRVTSDNGNYVVTSIVIGRVHFEPAANALNSFTWTRDDADQWTALLERPAAAGKPAWSATYVMRRMPGVR